MKSLIAISFLMLLTSTAYAWPTVNVSGSTEVDCNDISELDYEELKELLKEKSKKECARLGLGAWKFQTDREQHSCKNYVLSGKMKSSCIF